MADIRRILLDGYPTVMMREGEHLVARDGRTIGVDAAVHLPPVEPTKIICCHLNHISRVREFGVSLPPAPTYFHKPVSALNSHRAAVVRPSNCKWLNYEGEVAIVIGRTCRNVSYADAPQYIAGYTVANDYGLHDFRDTDSGSMLRVKGADTLCPLGPGLITDWHPAGKGIRTIVNGEVRQDGNTDEMAWDMAYLVADIARLITLVPGDVILSGTPAVSRAVYPGDVVTVEVEGLGALTNHIVDGPVPVSDEVGAQMTETEEVLSTAMGGDWPLRGQRRPRPTERAELPFPRIHPKMSE
jgi:5-oxopent-3-ene-1,2,5-tricarboxylate decarboxylase/2-hydroxyhepta-2,4-diene-1,7-dioate isomerase